MTSVTRRLGGVYPVWNSIDTAGRDFNIYFLLVWHRLSLFFPGRSAFDLGGCSGVFLLCQRFYGTPVLSARITVSVPCQRSPFSRCAPSPAYSFHSCCILASDLPLRLSRIQRIRKLRRVRRVRIPCLRLLWVWIPRNAVPLLAVRTPSHLVYSGSLL